MHYYRKRVQCFISSRQESLFSVLRGTKEDETFLSCLKSTYLSSSSRPALNARQIPQSLTLKDKMFSLELEFPLAVFAANVHVQFLGVEGAN